MFEDRQRRNTVKPARVAVRRRIWRECQPVRSKSWTRRGEDFQIGSQKEEERDAANLILYLKRSSSQDAGFCSRISLSGRLVENDARNTDFRMTPSRVDLTGVARLDARRILPHPRRDDVISYDCRPGWGT